MTCGYVSCKVTKVTGHYTCNFCVALSDVKWCVQLLYLRTFWFKKKKKSWWSSARFIKLFVTEFKFGAHCSFSHFKQMRNCHSRTSSALGGLLGRPLLFHWQLPSFHLRDEALLGLDLLWTDRLLIGDEGLDVLEQDIDLCTLLLQIPLKHVRLWQH